MHLAHKCSTSKSIRRTVFPLLVCRSCRSCNSPAPKLPFTPGGDTFSGANNGSFKVPPTTPGFHYRKPHKPKAQSIAKTRSHNLRRRLHQIIISLRIYTRYGLCNVGFSTFVIPLQWFGLPFPPSYAFVICMKSASFKGAPFALICRKGIVKRHIAKQYATQCLAETGPTLAYMA